MNRAFQVFCEAVAASPELKGELRDVVDEVEVGGSEQIVDNSLAEALAVLAHGHGIDLSEEDVLEALGADETVNPDAEVPYGALPEALRSLLA